MIAPRAAAPRLTRRQALSGALTGAVALPLAVAACGSGGRRAVSSGSTLESTWADAAGDGQLRVAPGEPMVARTDLGPRAEAVGELATLAHVTDAHVLDPSSPARVPFLDRLGTLFQSTFRPQEALTDHVLAGAVAAVRALGPSVVIQGGDLVDNGQRNELERGLAALRGGRIAPGSGRAGYYGVQLSWNTDPFYYRPDVDAPRHPGLLEAAIRAFASRGAEAPVLPVLGNHDTLVAGEIPPTPGTRAIAVGDRALWQLPAGLRLPSGAHLGAIGSADGPPDPAVIDELLTQLARGPTVQVPADPGREELSFEQVLGALGSGSSRLDYVHDVGDRLRIVVLDLVSRTGGSGGVVAPGQPAWLASRLSSAGGRWVIVVCHQPLETSRGAAALLEQLDADRRVIAVLAGHIHRNRIVARATPAGGYWLIHTSSLIDYPQQARALRVVQTAGGGVAIHTWMLDHVDVTGLGRISRELAYLDAQGGRVEDFAGSRSDRNAILYRRA